MDIRVAIAMNIIDTQHRAEKSFVELEIVSRGYSKLNNLSRYKYGELQSWIQTLIRDLQIRTITAIFYKLGPNSYVIEIKSKRNKKSKKESFNIFRGFTRHDIVDIITEFYRQ